MIYFRKAFFCFALLYSFSAQAITVDFDFDISYYELNPASPLFETSASPYDVSWEISYKSGPNWVVVANGQTTNTGKLHPAIITHSSNRTAHDTEWKLVLSFQDSEVHLYKDILGVSVTKQLEYFADDIDQDGIVDFGDYYYTNTNNTDEYSTILTWMYAKTARSTYQNLIGTSWPYGQIQVDFDAPGNTTSSEIRIEHIRYLPIYFHIELAQLMVLNDTTGSKPSACFSLPSASNFPFNLIPYDYAETSITNCSNSDELTAWNTPESSTYSIFGGVSAFIADTLMYNGHCNYEKSDYVFSFGDGENNPLDFDGRYQIDNIRSLLCDAIDIGFEDQSWFHQYTDPSVFHELFSDYQTVWSDAFLAMNSTYAYRIVNGYIHQVEFATGADNTIEALGNVDINQLSADDNYLCYYDYNSLGLGCKSLTNSYHVMNIQLPSLTTSVIDFDVMDNQIYIVVQRPIQDVLHHEIYMAPISMTTTNYSWSLVYSGLYEIETIAIDSSAGHSYIYTSLVNGPLYSCQTTSCTLQQMSYTHGYYRGVSVNNSLITDIEELVHRNGKLYVTEEYGVAEVGSTVEQIVGVGPDNIMKTNLSLRSMGIHNAVNPVRFAIDGSNRVFVGLTVVSDQIDKRDFNFETLNLLMTNKAFWVEDLYSYTREYFCGTENVTKPFRDVFEVYKGMSTSAVLSDILQNLNLSTQEKNDLKLINWIGNISNPECTWDYNNYNVFDL